MQTYLRESTDSAARLVNRRGSTAVAALLLSLGVGASTAAFALVNRVMPHSAPYVTCETTVEYASDLSGMPTSASTSMPTLTVPAPDELQERISDAYETSYEAAGDAVDSWSDAAGEVGDIGDLGGRIFAVLLGAGALGLLVACMRGASRTLATSSGSVLFVIVALGALPVAAFLASAFGLPALGLRAAAFAVAVSLVAAHWARKEQKLRVRLASAVGD